MPLPNGTLITRTSTGDLGVIVEFIGDFGVEVFRVRIKNATIKLSANEFVVVGAESDSPWERPLGLQAVRLRLAEIKIVHPFRETLASYGATKTEIHPYQFKPLLKLNRSALNRILIADEVGLGKTIEAGYIILEAIARDPYLSVVVVCPPMLRPKWRAELFQRFGLQFDIMTSSFAARRVARRDDEPSEPPLRAIVAYETIRATRFVEGLDSAEGLKASIGLLIADEAHRARNKLSLQSKSLEKLTTRSRLAVFLTATPIQNSDKDLFRLLEILLPDQFLDYEGFGTRRQANEIVVRAETAVSRANVALLDASIEELRAAPDSRLYREVTTNPYFADTLNRLAEVREAIVGGPLTDPKVSRLRIESQDALFRLNLLSPILNRTRRRDVLAHSAKRSPMAIDAQLSSYEQVVYDQLTRAVFTEYAHRHGEGVARFVLKGFQQGFASSLWAAVSRYRERFKIEEDSSDFDALEFDMPSPDDGSFDPRAVGDISEFPELKRVLAAVNLEQLWADDSKWKLLHRILTQHRSGTSLGGAPRKMLIFSYFKRSLDLIGMRLKEMGLSHVRIDGDVPTNALDPSLDERQRLIQKFREEPLIQIMIASQVGTEGLDLQFCDTVVNWDLPWNPMTVEQRIGRIDRIGQKAEILHVINIACRGTVEWDILTRLYNKIGIFRASIGDLEEILGEVAERLQSDISTTQLTPAQRQQRIDDQVVVLENVKAQQEVLDREAASLLTADSFLIDEFERIRRTGQFVQPHELESFVRERLRKVDPASSFVHRPNDDVWMLKASPCLIALADTAFRKERVVEWRSFLQRLRTTSIHCTFHGDRAEGNAQLEVLSVAHPLLRILVADLQVHERACHSFRCRLASDEIEQGAWLLEVGLVSDPHNSRGARVITAAARIGNDALLDADHSDILLRTVLEAAVDLYTMEYSSAAVEAAKTNADQDLWRRFSRDRDDVKKRGLLQRLRREEILASHHDRLIEAADQQVTTMRIRASFDKGARSILPALEGKARSARQAKEIAFAELPAPTGSALELFEHFVAIVVVSPR